MENSESARLYSLLKDLTFDFLEKQKSYNRFNESVKIIRETFLELYLQSVNDTFFWEFCTLKTYEITYEQRMNNFFEKFIDANKKDFIQSELDLLKLNYREKEPPTVVNPDTGETVYQYEGYIFSELWTELKISNAFNIEDIQKIDYSQKRKKKFLELKLNKVKEQPEIKESIQDTEILLDYSNNPKAERIVFLHELGILDFLKEKMNKELQYFAPNKLAEIISTFTDIKQSTSQSYLNPIFSKDTDNSKNPITENSLKKVKEKLMKIGFNNTKTT